MRSHPDTPDNTDRPQRQGRSSDELRRHNLSAIVSGLHRAGSESRAELTRRTGLNRSTIATLVRELVERGIVIEEAPKESRGPGRPSLEVRLADSGPAVLAIDVGVDSLAAAVVGLGGRIRGHDRIDLAPSRRKPGQVVEDVTALVRSVRASLPDQRLVGVGVSIVGIARRRDGLVRLAPNLGWKDEPLADHLRTALATDAPISVGNDADLGAIAELKHGAGVDVENLVFFQGEVGVGAGVVIDGRPVTGTEGYFGEVGHIVVNPEGRPCQCGSRGCLETEIGEPALLRAAGMDPARVGREAINEVLDAAAGGDANALRALRSVGDWLGLGVSTIVNIFNPQVIVLGGFLARLHPHADTQIESALGLTALPGARADVRVLPSRLGADATLLGAAELALAPVLADPMQVPVAEDAA